MASFRGHYSGTKIQGLHSKTIDNHDNTRTHTLIAVNSDCSQQTNAFD